jgi:hypothetical protein
MWLKTHMVAENHKKLLNAGFTIIRDEALHISGINYKCRIKAKTPTRREWFTLEKDFPSVRALTIRMAELLNDEKIIKD